MTNWEPSQPQASPQHPLVEGVDHVASPHWTEKCVCACPRVHDRISVFCGCTSSLTFREALLHLTDCNICLHHNKASWVGKRFRSKGSPMKGTSRWGLIIYLVARLICWNESLKRLQIVCNTVIHIRFLKHAAPAWALTSRVKALFQNKVLVFVTFGSDSACAEICAWSTNSNVILKAYFSAKSIKKEDTFFHINGAELSAS